MLSHPLVLYFLYWKIAFFYLVGYFWSHWFVAIGLVGRIHTNYQRAGATPAPHCCARDPASRVGGVAWLFYLGLGFLRRCSAAGITKSVVGSSPRSGRA